MSYLWSFQSFDAEKLVSLFSDPDGPAMSRLLDLVQSEISGFRDAEAATSVARAFVASGLSYDDLSERQARDADDLIVLIFSPEGFAEDLDVAYLSDEGFHPADVKELLARNPTAAVLPALVRGRRAGQDQPMECEYCFLSPGEVASVIDEVRAAIDAPAPWSEEWARANAEGNLLQPLASAGDRWVLGQLG